MEKIHNYLRVVKTHPTAETVYNAVKNDIPTITLATVYRNLNKMTECGEILRLEVNGEYRFDGDNCMHQHGICRKCGKIVDFFDEKLSNTVLNKFSGNGFEAQSVCIKYYGLCKKCGRKKNG